ncbi:MAG: hypothetical protein WBH31_17085, partial [Promethearchaeia archaeon]
SEGGGLKVEALQNSSAGRSLCYIDQNVVERLHLSTRSIIEIRGKKRTAGRVMPSIGDKGRNIIRLDDLQRLNAGVKVGDVVSIRKSVVFPAEIVEFTPTFTHIDLTNHSKALRLKLIDKLVVNGDVIDILGISYQNSDPSNQINQIMKLFRKSPKINSKSGLMRLVVEKTRPSNEIVRITKDTKISFNNWIAKLDEWGNILSYDDGDNSRKNFNREIVEELLLYTRKLEKRIHNIEIEKQLIHLERQRLDYGKRILNNAIERLKNITDKLMESPLLSSLWSETAEIQSEETNPDVLNNIMNLEENLKKLEKFVSRKPKEETDQNPRYCRYCDEKIEREENLTYCPHCGAQLR